MIEAKLDDLSTKIDALLKRQHALAQENHRLRQHIAKINLECNKLQEKNRQASTKIKHIISQFKEETAW